MPIPTSDYKKPTPKPTEDSQPFWDFCKKHELRFQKCSDCGTFRHYPRPLCPECASFNLDWVQVGTKGTVHSWVTARRPFHPGFADEMPLAIVIADVEEAPGVRLMGNFMDGTAPDSLSMGMPIEIAFDDVTEDWTLPKFKKA